MKKYAVLHFFSLIFPASRSSSALQYLVLITIHRFSNIIEISSGEFMNDMQNGGRKHLFVVFDTTMEIGLRGPTNLFGHPTDEQLMELDQAFSQWDTDFDMVPVTKIAFGHFPMSFTALTESGKSIKDVFLKHSLAAYLCGHLHARFGKNLKRYYQQTAQEPSLSDHYYQFNMHQGYSVQSIKENCSEKAASH